MKVFSRIDEIPSGTTDAPVTPGTLVLEGGAWRGLYTQGALDTLMQEGILFKTTIGVSAGAMSALGYLSGQIGWAPKVNLSHRYDSRYCGLKAVKSDHGVTGFTFSILPLEFGLATVFTAFAFAAVMFFACAVIGHYTNVDLSRISGIMIGGLFALVLASVLALFIPSLRNGLVISYIGVILFGALTAWDMQRVKAIYYQTQGNEMLSGNLAVYGAFELYLDFINMFLYILRIVGSRSSSRN